MYLYQDSDKDIVFSSRQTALIPEIPVGIYKLQEGMGGFYLKNLGESFKLPSKIYNFTGDFVDRVTKAWSVEERQLGTLLWGLKGTGKSITAKILCNSLNLPVICIDRRCNFSNFINSIQQDIVVFIDEIEKVFADYDYSDSDSNSELVNFLSLLDGVNVNSFRRFYIFTSNEKIVNKYLDNRPSRIRYRKQFSNLPKPLVEEIVDDILLYPEFRDDLVATCSKLEYITLDAIQSLTKEVNIQQQPASVLFADFNLDYKSTRYAVSRREVTEDATNPEIVSVSNKVEYLGIFSANRMSDTTFNGNDVGYSFRCNGTTYGDIERVLDDKNIFIRTCVSQLDEKGEPKLNEDGDEITVKKLFLYTVEEHIDYNLFW